ncbi:MarR family winged helix-turn-helix transcriptional regulator [uncultured Jatrophihabitans sp.]|uniref:MarR family winged helix-turn-helix transcriptional regulator n=1 Tax=uncultured Jatrophihabitans sp. TaxID=1610747 RepID=UPI0035CA4E60
MSGPGAADDDTLAADWHRIRTGAAMVQRRLDDAVEAEGVTAQYFAVLHMLLASPSLGLPMTVLARDLAMTSGGFTKLADRMAKDGLLDRRGVAGDRRVVHAALTEPGRELAERVEGVYREALRDSLLAHVEPSQVASAAQILERLGAAHAPEPSADDPGLVATRRDPALPDRRGRGRVGE